MVALHTDGQGPNCVYGVDVHGYCSESEMDIDEDEVLLLAEGAAQAIISGKAVSHTPIIRPDPSDCSDWSD